MDEDNKEQNDFKDEPQRQHVHIFGAEVNSSGERNDSGADTKGDPQTKDDWRARKDEWRVKHGEQREEWKARRQEWRHDHRGGGLFVGLVILLVGVLALLYTMGFVSRAFWHAIIPFWPVLLILWGASIALGRHWFARFIVFLLALAFMIAVILYGLVRADSPVVSSLSPTVVSAIQNTNPR
jgi:hypothetical protein